MIHRFRRIGVVVLSIACMCLIAACGSSSKSSSGSGGTTPVGHFAGFKLTEAQRACLKKKGVTLPTGGGNFRGGPPNGKFPKGKFHKGKFQKGKFQKGKFQKGKFPKGGFPRKGFAGQNSKRLAAFKACGVSFPSRPGGGAPPSTTTG
jgi:hypothetical protein